MYPECDDILWNDPMECLWCAFANATGQTISREEQEGKCQAQNGFLLESCPPIISDVCAIQYLGKSCIFFQFEGKPRGGRNAHHLGRTSEHSGQPED